jgi:hypothetical protein
VSWGRPSPQVLWATHSGFCRSLNIRTVTVRPDRHKSGRATSTDTHGLAAAPPGRDSAGCGHIAVSDAAERGANSGLQVERRSDPRSGRRGCRYDFQKIRPCRRKARLTEASGKEKPAAPGNARPGPVRASVTSPAQGDRYLLRRRHEASACSFDGGGRGCLVPARVSGPREGVWSPQDRPPAPSTHESCSTKPRGVRHPRLGLSGHNARGTPALHGKQQALAEWRSPLGHRRVIHGPRRSTA